MTQCSQTTASVLLVGTFPPPVNGAAVVNEAMADALQACGCRLTRLNLVHPTWGALRNRPLFLLIKAVNLLQLLLRVIGLAFLPRHRTLYISTAGRRGKLFEFPFLAIARLRQYPIWIHHHSFVYLNAYDPVTDWSCRLAGAGARHIVLCQQMAGLLTDKYAIPADRVRAQSNSGLLDGPATRAPTVRKRLMTIGFISNLGYDKGIDRFLEVCDALQQQGSDILARVAGPCDNLEIERLMQRALQRLERLEYVGPRYGPDQVAFYESIDLLLFPSLNEAEPLVVHEANAHGVPVLALDRGCIAETLADGGGETLADDRFITEVCDRLREWRRRPAQFEQLSLAALHADAHRRQRSASTLVPLLNEIAAARPPTAP